MRPLTFERPKALCTVCNTSLLARTLTDLRASGFDRVSVSLPPCRDEVAEMVRRATPVDLQLDPVFPKGPAPGSAAAALEALSPSAARALVIYGDSLLSVDFRALVAAHEAFRPSGAQATILYHRPPDLRQPERDGRTYHGVMSVDGEGRVVRFEEKPAVTDIKPGFDLANAGVFVVERSVFDAVAARGSIDFSRDVFQPMVSEGRATVFGSDIMTGFRRDVGELARFYEANLAVLEGQLIAPLPGTEVRPDVWVGAGSSYQLSGVTPPVLLGKKVVVDEGVALGPRCVVGDGCRIGAGSTVRASVLLESCEIGRECSVEACIIGPGCRLAHGTRLPRGSVIGPASVVGGLAW